VVNLDEKLEADYRSIIDFHKSNGKIATVATNNIKNFKGIYIFEPEILPYIPKGFSMLEDDIFPKLVREDKISIYPIIK
jgi:NDP-sugar pyrophosphorylase family protein